MMTTNKLAICLLFLLTVALSSTRRIAVAFVIGCGARSGSDGVRTSSSTALDAFGQPQNKKEGSKRRSGSPRSVQEKRKLEKEGRNRSSPRSVQEKRRLDAEKAAKAAENRLWNPFRFANQSSKFVPAPFQPKPPKRDVKPGNVLWKPGQRDEASKNEFAFQFAPLDDVVMGGASSSNFDDATGTWRGAVTDANNGGFVGIRNTPNFDWDLTKCGGIELYLKNRSGKPCRFKLGLRDTTDFNGFVWSESFDVDGGSGGGATRVRVPLRKLKPTKFARVFADDSIEPLRTDSVVGIQLVYSKFEYDGNLNPKFEVGDVDLQILEIRAY